MINFNSFYFSIIHVFGVESFQANVSQSAQVFNVYSNWILKRFQHSLFVHYRVYKHSFTNKKLERELVLVNPDNALQECCNP